jgi:hypothetical protein
VSYISSVKIAVSVTMEKTSMMLMLRTTPWSPFANTVATSTWLNAHDEFEFVATQGDNVQDFKSFDELQSFILGEPDDGIESHTDWHFGIKGRKLYSATSKEEAEKAMATFEDKCRWEVWENLDKNEENTTYTPKREWLESELKSVSGQLEKLQNKKRRLEKILEPQPQ